MTSHIQQIKPTTTSPAPTLGLVLVVDDEEHNRTLLRDPLEARGYEVEEAENGVQAFKKMAARLPDVILLDLMMPKMDGFEVCRRMRHNPKSAHIPILMVTALAERKERLMGIEAGASDFLSKPVDIQDVILRVGNAVYAKHLRDQLQGEQEKSEGLLLNILPKAIADRMKNGETNIADLHPDATVLVADLVGFTSLAAYIDPELMVQLLNEIFSSFDALVEKHGLEKIKTIGDAYMVAGGLAVAGSDHVERMAELAIELRLAVEQYNKQSNSTIRLRVGISTGPVIAGVIGTQRFAYDVWGETVNLACRLESTATAGKIQISPATCKRLKDTYQVEERPSGSPGEPAAYWLGARIEHPALAGVNEPVA